MYYLQFITGRYWGAKNNEICFCLEDGWLQTSRSTRCHGVFIYFLYGRPVGGRCVPEVVHGGVRHTKLKPLFQNNIPATHSTESCTASLSGQNGYHPRPPYTTDTTIQTCGPEQTRRDRSLSLREVCQSPRRSLSRKHFYIRLTRS